MLSKVTWFSLIFCLSPLFLFFSPLFLFMNLPHCHENDRTRLLSLDLHCTYSSTASLRRIFPFRWCAILPAPPLPACPGGSATNQPRTTERASSGTQASSGRRPWRRRRRGNAALLWFFIPRFLRVKL
jgi:hypothetical protein